MEDINELIPKRLSFTRISLRNIIHNKGKVALTLSLYTIIVTVLIFSIYIGFSSFSDYINEVLAVDMPQFSFDLRYGMSTNQMRNLREKFGQIDGVHLETFKYGGNVYLWYDKINRNELSKSFYRILPLADREEHFGARSFVFKNLPWDKQHLVDNALKIMIYAMNPEGERFDKIINSIDQGTFNAEAFERGDEVIVLMPNYLPLGTRVIGDLKTIADLSKTLSPTERMARLLSATKLMELSYDFRMEGSALKDESIVPGTNLHLTIPTGERESEVERTHEVRFIEAKVGAIVNSIDPFGVYPFSHTNEAPVIIGSYNFIHKAFPLSIYGNTFLSTGELFRISGTIDQFKYAKTFGAIYIDGDTDDMLRNVAIRRLAQENSINLEPLWMSSKSIYGRAFRVASIVAVLGLSIAILTLVILYNTFLSSLEGERERIGILQSLGVTKSMFRWLYFVKGLGFAFASLLISNGAFLVAVLIPYIGDGNILDSLSKALWLYPKNLHLITLVGCFILILATYYLPINRILKNEPVENIRSLTR